MTFSSFYFEENAKKLNNGEEHLEIININPGVDDDYLIKRMNEINARAKSNGKDLWVFFDELNTCDSLVLLTEIFMKKSYNGIKLEENIKLIGACNPYRKERKGKKISGLKHPKEQNQLVYLVNKLPQPLMYYVFNFGSIDKDDEDKYILSIISVLFTEDKILKERTRDIISKCHSYLRKNYDNSVVSLREISRFKECYKFFYEYYEKQNKFLGIQSDVKLIKIKSVILSIYSCYYIRLIDERIKKNFDSEMNNEFIKLVNYEDKEDNINCNEKAPLISKIKEPLKSDIKKNLEANNISEFNGFNQLVLIEENFLLKEIKLDEGIGINKSLRDNIFMLFVALNTKIPLIIIGKPGSGKSLSAHLIFKVMKGKYSESKFFSLFNSIIQSYFQGSYSTIPEEVENLFEIATGKLKLLIEKNVKKKDLPISMILFDELGFNV